MKNLSIKKVALGIFLAGYAATSAYADISAVQSTNPIQGTPPTIYHPTDASRERQMIVRITAAENDDTAIGNTVKAKVGNFIHIYYKLQDPDGDVDTDADHKVASSLIVYKKMTNTGWVPVTVNAQTRNVGENGHIYFKIPSDMAGAQVIGFTLQEVTPYGNPNENKWLRVDNIWKNTNPKITDGSETPSDIDVGPGDPDPDNPTGPIESDSLKLGIFKANSAGSPILTTNLVEAPPIPAGSTDTSGTPVYGDKLLAVVWLASDSRLGQPAPDFSVDTDLSTAYNFTWSLIGTADGVDANPADKTTLNTTTLGVSKDTTNGWGIIKLATQNSYYNALNGGAYKAGIQGFKLQVEAR